MKTKNKLILSILTLLTCISCSKNESDYIGDYQSYIGKKTVVGNSALMGMATFGRGRNDGFKVNDLSKIEISIFKDETTGKNGGHVFYTSTEYVGGGYTSNVNRTKKKLSITSMHMKGDTLMFDVNAPFTSNIIQFYLLKEGDKSFIGVEKFLSSKNDMGPLFDKNNGNFDQYKSNVDSLDTIVRDYLYNQMVKEGDIANDTLRSNDERNYASNALDFYKRMYTKK